MKGWAGFNMQKNFASGCFVKIAAEKREIAPQERGQKNRGSRKWWVFEMILRKVGRKSLWAKVWPEIGLNLWVMIRILVFNFQCGRLLGVSVCTQNYRMSPRDLYVNALAHVMLARSCVSSFWRTLSVGWLLCLLPTGDVSWIPGDGSGFNRYSQEHFAFLSPFKMVFFVLG